MSRRQSGATFGRPAVQGGASLATYTSAINRAHHTCGVNGSNTAYTAISPAAARLICWIGTTNLMSAAVTATVHDAMSRLWKVAQKLPTQTSVRLIAISCTQAVKLDEEYSCDVFDNGITNSYSMPYRSRTNSGSEQLKSTKKKRTKCAKLLTRDFVTVKGNKLNAIKNHLRRAVEEVPERAAAVRGVRFAGHGVTVPRVAGGKRDPDLGRVTQRLLILVAVTVHVSTCLVPALNI